MKYFYEKEYESIHDYYDDLEAQYFEEIEEAEEEYKRLWKENILPLPEFEMPF